MNIFSPERRERLVFWSSVLVAKISLLLVFALIGFEIYVRWFINQNFTFLGGFELEALTASAFAFTFGVLYLNRAR